MPLIPEPSTLNERARFVQKQQPKLGFADIMDAAFKTENTVGGLRFIDNFEKQPDYNPFVSDIEGYEEFADSFVTSRSPEHTAAIKARIDREIELRGRLASSGAKGIVAMMVASAVDPVELAAMMIPGGQAKKAHSVGSIMRGAFIGTGATEAVLQAQQETRSGLETGVNITASVLTAGVLGKAVSVLNKADFDRIVRKVDREMQPVDVDNLPTTGRSVGAAQAAETTLEDETLVAARAINFFTFGGKLNPFIRTMKSASVTARRTAQQLAESPLMTRKNKRGIRTEEAVETLLKREEGRLADGLRKNNDFYARYKKADGPLNRRDFNREVGKALRRGDVAEDPIVDAAAKAWRPFFDEYKNRAIALGQLPDGVKPLGADSYLTRVYLHDQINSQRGKWNSVLGEWLRGKGVDETEIPTIVNDITASLRGTPEGIIPKSVVPKSGVLKSRELDISDELIEEFLESDITVVANMYQRSIAPEILLREKFGNEPDLRSVIGQINDDYDAAVANVVDKPRKVRKLEQERTRTIKDIEAQRDSILHTYGLPQDPSSAFVRVARSARTLNYMSLLGGMTVSAIPDVARPVMQHGLRRTMGRGVVKLVTDLDRLKIAAEDISRMGAASEIILNTRARAIADIGDSIGSRFDDAVQNSSRMFSVSTGMVHWNDYMKRFSGLLSADRFLEASVKWSRGTIKSADIKRMAQSGIDEDMARRIAAQFAKHGDDGDLRIGQSYKWDDLPAREAYESAIIKDVDTAIVTPGLADKPLWTRTEVGKTVSQFKSFGFAAVNRVFLSSLQRRDGHTLSGLLAMFAFGAVTVWAKEKTTGHDISEDPGTLINNIIDRTGFFGILYDAKNMAERGTGRFLLGDQVASRYASRSLVSNALGPSLGTAETVLRAAYGVSQAEMTESDIHAVRRLIPFQNLFYTSWLLDALEDEVIGESEQ